MKANEAPEKIYISENPITNEPDERWQRNRCNGADIEYTRTDAFIEKACDWIEKNIGSSLGISSCAITKSFKEAMEN